MGFFFNLDSRLMNVLSQKASEKDLKTIRFIAVLLLDLWKQEIIEEYGEEVFQELHDRYFVTNKAEEQRKNKDRIDALKVLGFSEEEASKLCNISKDDLKLLIEASKAKGYATQSNVAQVNSTPHRKRILELEREKLRLEAHVPSNPQNQRWTENKLAEINRELEMLKNDNSKKVGE